jgi:hypothetical protein
MGLLFTVGVCQEKKGLDPRLILKKGEVWEGTGTDCFPQQSFYANGTYLYVDICKGGEPNDTTKGTWYTINNKLFEDDVNVGDYKIDEHSLFHPSFGTLFKIKP